MPSTNRYRSMARGIRLEVRVCSTRAWNVTVANDGGFVTVKAPAGAHVAILPQNAPNEACLSDAMVQGEIDASGFFTSGGVAPGKYSVIATLDPIDMTPECIAHPWRARFARHGGRSWS